jgi:hypothetical protein
VRARAAELAPLHPSVRKLRGSSTPLNMSVMTVSHEQSEAMQKIALGIFADCSNRGLAFSDALAAIYLSGLEHAFSALPSPEQQHGK